MFRQNDVFLTDASSIVSDKIQNLVEDFIKEKIGISVDLCRDETIINSGDRLLIMRLKYRVNPADKGKIVNEDDFEFFFANFQ